jgi:predicted RNA-binding protein
MESRNYCLGLLTGTTWQEFLTVGANIFGFRERRWRIFQRIKTGDYPLSYLTGISRWIGLLEVISTPYRDSTPIWKDAEFPCRLRVKVLIALRPETAVPVLDLQERLSIFRDLVALHK